MKSAVGIFMLISSLIILKNDVTESAPTESSYRVTVTQVNAQWNWKNNLDLSRLKGCYTQYAYLEEQTFSNQSQLQKIPVILVSVDGKVKRVFQGNIMLEPTVSLDSLQTIVDKLAE
jgi:hypothetical protein